MTSDNDLIWRGDALEIMNDEGWMGNSHRRIAALPAAPPQPTAVTVKPLVWERHPRGFMASAGGIGEAYIFALQPDGRYECIKGMNFAPRFETSDDAKAAAQADYEARIMAALNVQPITVQDAAKVPEVKALIDAVRIVHDSYWNSTDGVIRGMYDLGEALRSIPEDKA